MAGRDIKVLTVRQPWAWAIAEGYKTVENRSRPTKHRGPLAIHAGAAWAPAGGTDRRVLDRFGPWISATESTMSGIDPALHQDQFVFRAVIATVNVVDCHPSRLDEHCGCPTWGDVDLFKTVYHWVLADAVKLPVPVPAKGRLGLWDIELSQLEPVP